jgi:hypothetical protein
VLWCDNGHDWEGGLVGCLEPLIAKVAMPIAAHRAAGFRSKGLLRTVLRCLATLQRLLPVAVWPGAWANIGGTFWLSRCVLAVKVRLGLQATRAAPLLFGSPCRSVRCRLAELCASVGALSACCSEGASREKHPRLLADN